MCISVGMIIFLSLGNAVSIIINTKRNVIGLKIMYPFCAKI